MDDEKNYGQNSLWVEARRHYEAGRPEKAIEIYKYMLLVYADDPQVVEYANAYIGDMYLTLKKLDDSEKHLRKALEQAPQNADYHYLLGFVFNYRQKWDEAVKEMRIAVAGQPQKAAYWQSLGWTLYLKGEKDEGLELLLKAHQMAPDSVNILNDLAVVYMDIDILRARRYAEQAKQIDPHNALTHKTLAFIQQHEKDFTKVTQTDYEQNPDSILIFRFKVSLEDNPEIYRIIDIKYNQLLSTLHKAICLAFDRQQDRPYSFNFYIKRSDKRSEFASDGKGISGTASSAKSIRVDSILLYQDEEATFEYIFDFEKKRRHRVELIRATSLMTRAKYPRIVKKQGKYSES